MAELVSQRNEIFLSNMSGLQRGKGLQGHLGLSNLSSLLQPEATRWIGAQLSTHHSGSQ